MLSLSLWLLLLLSFQAKVGFGMNLMCCAILILCINTFGSAMFDLQEYPSWAAQLNTAKNYTLVCKNVTISWFIWSRFLHGLNNKVVIFLWCDIRNRESEKSSESKLLIRECEFKAVSMHGEAKQRFGESSVRVKANVLFYKRRFCGAIGRCKNGTE